jgi:type IV pilus assembly protein PilB
METRTVADIVREVTDISDEQLRQALDVQKETREPLAQILVNMGLITEKEKVRILGRQWGIPFLDLTEKQIDKDLLKLIPHHLLQRWKAVPVDRNGPRLVVAMVNPLDVYAIDQMRLVAGMDIESVIASAEDIGTALGQSMSAREELAGALQDMSQDFGGETTDIEVESAEAGEEDLGIDELRELMEDAPVVRLANLIIDQALRDKASDIAHQGDGRFGHRREAGGAGRPHFPAGGGQRVRLPGLHQSRRERRESRHANPGQERRPGQAQSAGHP